MSPYNRFVPLVESQQDVINAANPRRTLDNDVEHWLHVGRRATDDAEHLGRCGLMLQRFAQLSVPFLDFLEQPHILDRNYCLRGEGFQKSDLLVRERTNL